MSDWQDRWIDSALHELHGNRPPDLSARVVLALQEQQRGPLPELEPPTPQPSEHQPHGVSLRWSLAAAALVLLGVFVGALLAHTSPPGIEALVEVEVTVLTGQLECVQAEVGGERRSRHPAGEVVPFAARRGNRLLAAAPCRFEVGPLGTLATGPTTELEVQSMSVSWKHGVVAASSLTVAVVAGVVTWHTLNHEGTAVAGETVRLQSGGGSGMSASDAAELAQLRLRVRELEQENSTLQASRVAVEPAAEPTADSEPTPAATAELKDTGPTFTDDQYADFLAKMDFATMGEATNEMGPLLVDLAKAMEEGGEMPVEVLAKIQELNSKLLAQVPALMESGLPGSGANGSYTHPLVMANILDKTLDAAGTSMNASQRERIAGLVRLFSVEVGSVDGAQHEFALSKMSAEAETKDRFFNEVAAMLTPEQQKVMFPDGAMNYEGTSLFHSSLMTRQFVSPVSAHNPAEFARSVANTYGEKLGLDEQTSGQLRAVVERMSLSPELWEQPGNAVEQNLQMMRAGRTAAAMRNQIAIMREVLRSVPMSSEQRQQFVKMRLLFVPLPK